MRWAQETARYKTYLKETFVEALRSAWTSHPDATVKKTKIDIEYPLDRMSYPAIVIRFYERDLPTSGVGHFEYREDPNNDGSYIPYQRMMYHGDVEFMVLGLSSLDRDIVSDALVQTIKFSEVTTEGRVFRARIFNVDEVSEPYSTQHFVNVNLDNLQGFGETQGMAPWMPEDVLVYQVAYRMPVMGELLSPDPENQSFGLIEKVEQYPYMPIVGEERPDPDPETGITPWTSEMEGPFPV